MKEELFKGRQAVRLENDYLRVTILRQGGHIAEVFDKTAQISPLWIPPWDSVEPSDFTQSDQSQFGTGPDARLLAGIMGHNLCLDIFGAPSPQEARAGLTVHGEASVLSYEITGSLSHITLQLTLTLAHLRFSRSVELLDRRLRVQESVENLLPFDRPLAWTQHVTLGPPFLDPKTTQFTASMNRSFVAETDPGSNAYLQLGVEFTWPMAPNHTGVMCDLRKMHHTSPASGYTAHLADPTREDAFFIAFSPRHRLAFGYAWRRSDFPWLGIWEENCSRQASPWNGITLTRGMEFGTSPIPETRREMVDRHRLLEAPTYRWLDAYGRVETEYWISCKSADRIPEDMS